MKMKLQNMDIDNKKVLLRLDLNVPMKDGKILDDNKIQASLQTINYLVDHNAKIIILSHLGKVKTEQDKLNNSLEVVARRLKELVNTKVIFSKQTKSVYLTDLVNKLNSKDILVIENTRFEDVPNKLESNCDPELSSYWASLADVFVMDAFASMHRVHASTAGVCKYIPSCIGFLVQKEMDMLDKCVNNPEKPFTIIVGGAKLDDKLRVINKLINKCDHMLLTGGLANTFLKVLGFNIGESIVSHDELVIDEVKELLMKYKDKILLPFDVIVGNKYNDDYIEMKTISNIDNEDIIKDLGRKTLDEYKKIIDESATIFLNGTDGVYEDNRFANGTKEMLDIISNSKAITVVGGGDSVSAVRNFGYQSKFKYISTGGGATLKYIENGTLDALSYINDEKTV